MRPAYEDELMAVVYKPAGFCTDSDAFCESLPSLLQPPPALSKIEEDSISMRTPFGNDDALSVPLPLHNIDDPIAGLVAVAKSRAAARFVTRQFEMRQVGTTYHALLAGNAWVAGAAAADEDESSYAAFNAAVSASEEAASSFLFRVKPISHLHNAHDVHLILLEFLRYRAPDMILSARIKLRCSRCCVLFILRSLRRFRVRCRLHRFRSRIRAVAQHGRRQLEVRVLAQILRHRRPAPAGHCAVLARDELQQPERQL